MTLNVNSLLLFVMLVLTKRFSLSSSSSFISDTGSIEITIKQHRGQTGNIQKYTQNDQSNAETGRDDKVALPQIYVFDEIEQVSRANKSRTLLRSYSITVFIK